MVQTSFDSSNHKLFKWREQSAVNFYRTISTKILALYFQWPGFKSTFNLKLFSSCQNLKRKKCGVSLHSRDDPGFWPETTDCHKIAFALLFKSWAKWKTPKLRPKKKKNLYSAIKWNLLGKAQPHCNKGKSINHNYIKRERKNQQCHFLSKIWYLLLYWQ